MKRLSQCLLIICCFMVSLHTYAQTELIGRSEVEELRWGGVEHGWDDIFLMENITVKRGPMARLDIMLGDNSPLPDENTDLLLSFDRCRKDGITNNFPHYTTHKIDIFPSRDIKKFGASSAGFVQWGNVIQIKPMDGSIFVSDTTLQSFTIDFFLFPMTVHDGTTIISWYAPTVDYGGNFTGFKVFFKDGKLFWLFENVFQDQQGNLVKILSAEFNRTPLDEWHHHALYYNADTGLLTLYYDGKESDLILITETGTEEGTVLKGEFSPYLAVPLTIGEKFLGYVDEFRVSKGKARFSPGIFRKYGVLKSNVIDLQYNGTKLVKILWESTENNGTAVRVFCRIANRYFLPFSERKISPLKNGLAPEPSGLRSAFEERRVREAMPEWVPVKNNREFRETIMSGRYFQWKAELYGTRGIYSPVLHTLSVWIEPDPPPDAPLLISVLPLDGGVRLKWVKNRESDVTGYKVYYGDASRNYFGKGAVPGDSPVFVDTIESIELLGLENERVYFISITAVDSAHQESGFSKEFIVRPSGIHESED